MSQNDLGPKGISGLFDYQLTHWDQSPQCRNAFKEQKKYLIERTILLKAPATWHLFFVNIKIDKIPIRFQ